jgi:cell division protein ZapE
MQSLVDTYKQNVSLGKIQREKEQERLVILFDTLRVAVEQKRKKILFSKSALTPKGIYLWGGVGCGKSMIMDMFVESLTVEVRRLHFHSFMQEVQSLLNLARQSKVRDALVPVVKKLTNDVKVLALDELQIKDIADAMIVGRLFEALMKKGVTVVITSNRPPIDLYKNGLNRDLFLPFIRLIEAKFDVLELCGVKDYRQSFISGDQVYFYPLNLESAKRMDTLWATLTGNSFDNFILSFKGREIIFPFYKDGVGRFDFFEICGQMFGPGDYLAIVDAVRVLMVDNIPQLSRSNFNEAKRFVTLIDAAYEAKISLICSAATEPEMLYTEGEGSFEFERTASRLKEMQSKNWLNVI